MISEELECAWTYVGRFMWRFAEVEWQVNEIFVNVFDLNEGASLMVVGYLDFGKKLQLIDVGLRNQGVDHSDIIKRLRKLADVRNIVAHFPFSESLTSKEAVDFTYINRRGEQRMPWQSEESETVITYAQFDSYDVEACNLLDVLENMHIPAIANITQELAGEIEDIIASSNNVIRFSKRPRNDK